MSNYASNETLAAAGAIVGGYASNPSVKIDEQGLMKLIDQVYHKLASLSGAGASHGLSESVRSTLEGSVAYFGDFDPASVWPDSTPEQREKFVALMEKHHIPHDAEGRPIPRRSADRLVEDWQVYDPISGEGYKMMKRHLAVAYGMGAPEMRAMFHLNEQNFMETAPAYSESKAKQAAEQGLGRGSKKRADAEESRRAAAARPARAPKATPAAAPVAQAKPARTAKAATKGRPAKTDAVAKKTTKPTSAKGRGARKQTTSKASVAA